MNGKFLLKLEMYFFFPFTYIFIYEILLLTIVFSITLWLSTFEQARFSLFFVNILVFDPFQVAEIKDYLPKACPSGDNLILDGEVMHLFTILMYIIYLPWHLCYSSTNPSLKSRLLCTESSNLDSM